MRWELDDWQSEQIRLWRQICEVYFMGPVHRMQHGDEETCLLTPWETRQVIWGIESAVIGEVLPALNMFEHRLLPLSHKRGWAWHAAVLQWSAMCRILLCDPQGAMVHILAGEKADLIEKTPELEVARGISLRLLGNHAEAVGVLSPLADSESSLYPWQRLLATAWLYESRVAGNLEPARLRDIRWLQQKSTVTYRGSLGILHAAQYRLSSSLEHLPDDTMSMDDLLSALDTVPPFERPVLMMLIEDILPRPLAGIQHAMQPPEFYEKES